MMRILLLTLAGAALLAGTAAGQPVTVEIGPGHLQRSSETYWTVRSSESRSELPWTCGRSIPLIVYVGATLAREGWRDWRIGQLGTGIRDRASAAVARGLPAGPFRGVPYLVKDLDLYIRGTPTTSGRRSGRAPLVWRDRGARRRLVDIAAFGGPS